MVPKAGNVTAGMESEETKIVSRSIRIAISETLSQRNSLKKQRKMVTSTLACIFLLSWVLLKADPGPIS